MSSSSKDSLLPQSSQIVHVRTGCCNKVLEQFMRSFGHFRKGLANGSCKDPVPAPSNLINCFSSCERLCLVSPMAMAGQPFRNPTVTVAING